MGKFLNYACAFTVASLLTAGTVSAGIFYQSDENTPVVEGTAARASFQFAAGGSLSQIDFDAFIEGQVLTGNEFSAQGVTLRGMAFESDPDDPLIPFPGFTRCISVNDSNGDIFVVDSTSTSQSGTLEVIFDTPSSAVGITLMIDPEGGDERLMEIYAPGGALIGTSPLVLFDDTDDLTSAFVGWVGSGNEVAERIVIGLDSDGMGYCSVEFNPTPPSPVPTMSVSGLGLLALMLGVFGFFGFRRQAGSEVGSKNLK